MYAKKNIEIFFFLLIVYKNQKQKNI